MNISILRDEAGSLQTLHTVAHGIRTFAIKPGHADAIKCFAIDFGANDIGLLPSQCLAIALHQAGSERAGFLLGRWRSKLNREITRTNRRCCRSIG